MLKTVLVGLIAGVGAFAGAAFIAGAPLRAADEIRCRVNAEALLHDIAAISARSSSNSAPHQSDRDALQDAINASKRPKP